MTEQEWRVCTDPARMLQELRGKVTERKLRLFGVACCRRIWHLLPDERSRHAVEVAEALADGLASDAEAVAAANAAAEVAADDTRGVQEGVAWRAARAADHLLPLSEEAWQLDSVWEYAATAMEGEQLVKSGATPDVLDAWSEQSVESGRPMGWTAIDHEAILADVLREVVGSAPFRRVLIDPVILLWNDRTLTRIAEGIHAERKLPQGTLDNARLAILADALLDAGCDNDDLIQHCREPGPHVRGCWALDLALNKE